MAAADPRLAWLLPTLLAWVVIVIVGQRLARSLNTRVVATRGFGDGVSREHQPRAYWSLVVLMCVLFVAAVAVAALLTLMLVAALTGAVPPRLLLDPA